MIELKVCRCCKLDLPVDSFGSNRARPDGLSIYCKRCHCAKAAEYRERNPEVCAARVRAGHARRRAEREAAKASPEAVAAREAKRLATKERRRELARVRYQADPNRHLEKARRLKRLHPERYSGYRQKHRQKAKASPEYVLANRMRSRVYKALRRGRVGRSWRDLVDYSVEELRAHLERQFLNGMSWENMGEWHIDHIVPVSSFDASSPDCPEFRRAWSLPNLRPMWGKENISKGAKIVSLL